MTTFEARKKAPPEKAEAISLRTKIILSFWGVILLLGLPTWLKTTEIYRANLPLEQMLALSEGIKELPTVPLRIWLSLPGKVCDDAERLAGEAQTELETLHSKSPLRPHLRLVHDDIQGLKCGTSVKDLLEEKPDFEVYYDGTDSQYRFDLQSGVAKAYFKYPESQERDTPKALAASISDVFVGEAIAHLLNINSLVSNHAYQDEFARYPGDAVREIEKQIARAAKTSPEYHVTFSLFSAAGAPSSWDIKSALEQHIQPLVHALQKTANIQIGTQVQLFSPYSPSIQSSQLEGTKGNFLEKNDLTSFVNAAEWPLSPSVGNGPTLNFIVYIPTKADTPLGIDGSLGGAWLVPQWGGIHILNPKLLEDAETGAIVLTPHLTAEDLSDAFKTFSSQLLGLLGVPATDPAGNPLPLPIRLGTHQRISAMSLHLKAASSLASLARLAKHLSSIPIPKDVSQFVENSMANLTASDAAMSNGQWDEAVRYASLAYQDSEKAFFDKSMVGQAYFPDEHKMAVYLPLLGPTGLPLVVSLLREVKKIVTALKARKNA